MRGKNRPMKALATCFCAALAITLIQRPAEAQSLGAGEAPERVYLEADNALIEDRGEGLYIARGNVRMRAGQRVLHADELIYDLTLGRVTARGSVAIFDGDQPAQFADEVELDDQMIEGVALGFATLLENNGKAASAAALRRPDGSVELSDAYYTACDLCEDGERDPTWRLRADRVVRDLENQMVYYRDVRLEILGQPILYSPAFAHADPSAPRKSGFLLPSVDVSNRLGFNYQQPYYWAIGPSQDLTIAPRLMTEANPLLELDWRKRFYSGQVNIETSFTYEQEFNEDDSFGEEELRGHIFGAGRFDLSPRWRWGFGVQAVTDDLYLRRYDYDENPEEFGALYSFDQRTLINQLYVAGRGERFYADTAVLGFDNLNPAAPDGQTPFLAPFTRARADLPFPRWAGGVEARFNAAALQRERGDDYARASAQLEWARPVVLPGGLRLEPFALGRIDAYAVNETDRFGVETDTENFTRALGLAGADLSWPFVRPSATMDIIVAPRLAMVTASGVDDEDVPPNTDSQVLDLDRSSLFSRVRAPGFDVWEDGARADVGFELTARHRVFEARGFAGRSYRLDGDASFDEGSGLFEDESDWVAEIGFNVADFSIDARSRIDAETGELNRVDLDAAFAISRLETTLNYRRIQDDAARRPFEEVRTTAALNLTRRWQLTYEGRFDLETDETRQVRAGVRYRDECTDLRIFYERDNISIGELGPSESIRFEVVLFTLGGVGER